MKLDLTTKSGLNDAIKVFDRYGWIIAPQIWILKKIIDAITTTSDTTKAQVKAAKELMKAAKDNGAESLDLTLDQDAGAEFCAGIEGCNVKTKIGKSGKMNVKLKFKQT